MLALLVVVFPWGFAAPAGGNPGAGAVLLLAEPFGLDATVARSVAPGPRVALTATAASEPDPLASAQGVVSQRDAGASADDAVDRELALAIGSATSIELLGGTWLAWHEAAQRSRHERRWVHALREAHAAGAHVVATGGAAAWVARWSVQQREIVRRPAQDPHDAATDVVVEGLGLVDGPLVGLIAPLQPGGDRAVERAIHHGWRDVLLLSGPVGWLVQPGATTSEVVGAGAVAWVDLKSSRRSRDSVSGARLALLRGGDTWDLARRSLAGAEPGGCRTLELRRLEFDPRVWLRALSDGDEDRPAALVLEGGTEPVAGSVRALGLTCDVEARRRPDSGGRSGLSLDLEIAR